MDTEKVINETSAKIAAINDSFRRSMQGCTITRGVVALGSAANEVFVGVRDYSAFTEDNDPYGEHDFGSLKVAGQRVFWKIDYYDEKDDDEKRQILIELFEISCSTTMLYLLA